MFRLLIMWRGVSPSVMTSSSIVVTSFPLISLITMSVVFSSSGGVEGMVPWNSGECPQSCSCSRNTLPSTETGVASIAPALATHPVYNTVQCGRQQLTKLPLGLPGGTHVLMLRDNKIEDISIEKRIARSVKFLDVSYNNLLELCHPERRYENSSYSIPATSVPSDTTAEEPMLMNFTAVKSLNLQHNHIQHLDNITFTYQNNLEILKLDNNILDDIDRGTFTNLEQLEELSLTSNQLREIRRGWFDSTTRLIKLDLSHNQVMSIEENSFQSLTKISVLLLGDNRLETLTKKMFIGMSKLQRLDISFNSITQVPTGALSAFNGLKACDISQNPVTSIESGDFLQLRMRELQLHHMQNLTRIEDESFVRMPRLKYVYIHDNNRLAYISPIAFKEVPQLQVS